ncbi:hypothetical protein IFM47457_02861 [Aspergillus lentulus]|nr:hypothetical protein IFM47457_02861 [Aspergillus lentulus]
MEDAMKKEKEKKKMQTEKREEKGMRRRRKRGKWQVNRSYPRKKEDAGLDFWKATPEKISDNGGDQ